MPSMAALHPAVESKLGELFSLCRRYGVDKLEVFGSATSERFDAAGSDVDFLVELQPASPGELSDRYFGLLEALEHLFGRPIYLVMTRAIRNPYFLEGIGPSRTLLYAA
jgi:predicted nucleotidyltransferase